jgi:hypothetical protein
MRKKLHPIVLVVGILQVLFGLAGMAVGCVSIGLGVMILIDSKYDVNEESSPFVTKMKAPGGARQLTGEDLEVEIIRRVPSYAPEQIASALPGIFLSFLMIVSGAGLLFMQSWARWLAFGYAALSVFRSVIDLGYRLVFVYPAIQAIADKLNASGSTLTTEMAKSFMFGFLSVTILQFALVVYPLFLVIVLMIQPVQRAFRAAVPDGGAGDPPGRDGSGEPLRGEKYHSP